MLEAYAIGVTLTLDTNINTVLDNLIRQFQDLDTGTRAAQKSVERLAVALGEMKGQSRGFSSMVAAIEKLNSARLSGGLLGDLDKAVSATGDMALASDRLMTIMRENARLAAQMAESIETAARASARASSSGGGGGPGSAPGRGGRPAGHSSFGGHDYMLLGLGAGAVAAPTLDLYRSAFSRDASVEHLRQMLLQDTRVTPATADSAVAASYDATKTAPGSRVSENLASILDLKNITGSLSEATTMLPGFSKLSTLLQLLDRHKGGQGDATFAAGKAMDILGAMIDEHEDASGHTVREINPERLQQRLSALARVEVATNGRVDPQNYLAFAKQARAAGMLLSDEFTYEKLPAISMVMGGSRAGTALMSMAQVFQGGKLSKDSMAALMEIGLAGPGGLTEERDPRTHKMHTIIHAEAIYDRDVMSRDPVKWMEAAQKRMEAAGIHGTEDQIKALMNASQRSTIAGMFADILKDLPATLREQQNIRNTDPNAADNLAKNDPTAKMQQFEAAWDKLLTSLGSAGMTDAMALLDKATAGLNKLADWATANPGLARVAIDVAGGLGAIASALAGLSTAIFLFGPALKLLTSLGGGSAAGAEAAGAAAGLGLAAGGLAVGGAVALGGVAILGSEYETEETRQQQQGLARQRRFDPMQTPSDGYDVSGRPVTPATPSSSPRVNLGPQSSLPLPVYAFNMHVDGRVLASIVTDHQARDASAPSIGGNRFDPSVTILYPDHGLVG